VNLNLFRVSITGPESTGKSWLAEQLARHYRAALVPEVSRAYLGRIGRPYRYDDIVRIAKEQFALENETASGARGLLFCDTDLLVCKVWSLFKYGKCDPWIETMTMEHRYDLYLLCAVDLPWEYDPLREHPGQRAGLFSMYRDELQAMKADYAVVSGAGNERLLNAIKALENRFEEKSERLTR
jgi:NadR type nicotinamide-nucleotide adenylyltransferase